MINFVLSLWSKQKEMKVYIVIENAGYEGYYPDGLKVFLDKNDAELYANTFDGKWSFGEIFETELIEKQND